MEVVASGALRHDVWRCAGSDVTVRCVAWRRGVASRCVGAHWKQKKSFTTKGWSALTRMSRSDMTRFATARSSTILPLRCTWCRGVHGR